MPQALTGQLPEARKDAFERAIRRIREPNLARGVRRVSVGFAFLVIVAVLFLRGSPGFGEIWLLIPAFLLLGKGIGEIVSLTTREREAKRAFMPVQTTGKLSPAPLFDPAAPPSITEGTTRNLDNSAKT